MAAALGMLLGAGATYLGRQAQQQRALEFQQKEEFHQGFDQFLNSNPAAAANPEVQKIGKQVYGKLWEPKMQILGFAAQAKQKEDQQFQALTGGGQQSQQGQPAAAPQGGQQPQQAQPKQPQTPQEWEAYRHQLIQARGHFTDPAHLKALDDEIAFAKDQTDKAEHHAEYLQTQQRIQQQEQESNQIRLQGQQLMAGLHADTLALQQQNAQFMHQMQQDREDDSRKAHFQSATQNLATQTANIAKMLSAATPADPKTVKALLNARNANARALKAQAEKSGIDYDPEQFKPLTVEEVPGFLEKLTGGSVGGGTPALSEGSDTSGGTASDPLIGKGTQKADGTYELNGKHYSVKGGKIVGLVGG